MVLGRWNNFSLMRGGRKSRSGIWLLMEKVLYIEMFLLEIIFANILKSGGGVDVMQGGAGEDEFWLGVSLEDILALGEMLMMGTKVILLMRMEMSQCFVTLWLVKMTLIFPILGIIGKGGSHIETEKDQNLPRTQPMLETY